MANNGQTPDISLKRKLNLYESDPPILSLSLSLFNPEDPINDIAPPPPPPPRNKRKARAKKNNKDNNALRPPPYPWATEKIAKLHTFEDLRSMGITEIVGEVECRVCNQRHEMSFGLRERFEELCSYIASNKASMHDRAPDRWMTPRLARCGLCGEEGTARPVIQGEGNKEEINWLFLLLGEWLGLCTLEQLKYFCMHCGVHRTGAKNRVVYLTYLEVCKQLDPDGPFDH